MAKVIMLIVLCVGLVVAGEYIKARRPVNQPGQIAASIRGVVAATKDAVGGAPTAAQAPQPTEAGGQSTPPHSPPTARPYDLSPDEATIARVDALGSLSAGDIGAIGVEGIDAQSARSILLSYPALMRRVIGARAERLSADRG